MKRFTFIFALLLATTTMMAEKFTMGNLTFKTLSDTEVELVGANKGITNIHLNSPITYQGKSYSVTSIGYFAFEGCKSLTSVTIPNSVKSIGKWAFKGTALYKNPANWENGALYIDNCLIKVDKGFVGHFRIKENTRVIAGGAFEDCKSLTSVTIPNSVTSIGKEAFAGCSSLTSITIPNSVTSIGDAAFSDCSSLTSITIPNSVTSIGEWAFAGCSALNSITIPNSVTSIGDDAFYRCSSLTSVTIPNSVTSIGVRAFYDCTALKSIHWNAHNAQDASASPFDDIAYNITSFTFGDSVQHIPASLCKRMYYLKNITIPANVKTIGDYAFQGCTALKSIHWNAHNAQDASASPFDDIAYNITSFTFGDSVQHIPASLCKRMYYLKNITIPANVKTIGDYAFQGCTALKSIHWNAHNAQDASASPFDDIAYNITSFTFGDSVQHIPASLCKGMSKLTQITIPTNVLSIGVGAFSNCTNLLSFVVEKGHTLYDSSNQYNAVIETSSNRLVIGCPSTIIPESVTSIGPGAFAGCSELKTIKIPESVTSIEYGAFLGCSSLRSLKLPSGVTSIGEKAFYDCYSLRSIKVPSSVTSIGLEAFPTTCKIIRK